MVGRVVLHHDLLYSNQEVTRDSSLIIIILAELLVANEALLNLKYTTAIT